MNILKKMLMVFCGNLFMILRVLTGCKVKYNVVNMISPISSIRTFGKGYIVIDKKVSIRPNTELTARNGRIEIGNNCFINRNCMLVSHKRIIIEDNVTIGPGTMIYDHDHDGKGGYISSTVSIGAGTWIGAGCIILKGVSIGQNTIIGAGTIITKDIPNNSTVIQVRDTKIITGESNEKE